MPRYVQIPSGYVQIQRDIHIKVRTAIRTNRYAKYVRANRYAKIRTKIRTNTSSTYSYEFVSNTYGIRKWKTADGDFTNPALLLQGLRDRNRETLFLPARGNHPIRAFDRTLCRLHAKTKQSPPNTPPHPPIPRPRCHLCKH